MDEETCIKCGLCEKVCPILNQADKLPVQEVLAVKNPDDEERMNSSSGGVFLPLAREVINKGGVVFGAVYDESREVHHVYAEKIEYVYPMMGSKYLQSRIETAYRDAERFLKQGREVMFVGSPCQIAGLRTFLRNKEYPNLLAVDFLYHGVPSPGVWRRYLAETDGGYDAKERSRRKATAGKNIVLSSDIHSNNPFMRGFLSDIYLRPSCYECKCKNGVNHSDLTIADFGGINNVNPEFDDDKGVGLVLVNTQKGKVYFDKLGMVVHKSSLEIAQKHNGGFKEHTKAHPKRSLFFAMISKGKTIKDTVDICLQIPFSSKILNTTKRLLKKMVKKVLSKTGTTSIKVFLKR